MIKEFYHDKETLAKLASTSTMLKMRHENEISLLAENSSISNESLTLEADHRSSFTDKIEKRFSCGIDTVLECDFNWELLVKPGYSSYDYIISAHVIEHLVNPLTYLVNIYKLLSPAGELHIFYPQRPKFLMIGHHYHEIDDYRFRLLVKEAGFKIKSYIKTAHRKPFLDHLKGLRPFLRYFLDKDAYYILKK